MNMTRKRYKYNVNFENMSGSEIEDYLNDAPTPKVAVAHLWDYIEEQGTPYDWRWYDLGIKPYRLDLEVLVAIVKSYNTWDSDFELDCIKAIAEEAKIYDIFEYEPWKDKDYSIGDIVYELGKILHIRGLYLG